MARAKHAHEDKEGAGRIALRVAAALVGNYGLTVGVASLLAAALASLGMARAEAATLACMLAFLFFLVIVIVAFHARSVLRLWVFIVLVGGASTVLAHTWAEALA